MSRATTNVLLLGVLLALVSLEWSVRTDATRPNVEVFPDMVHAVPAETFAANSVLPGGRTSQPPPEGSIARGIRPLPFAATPEGAVRAGEILVNPLAPDDAEAARRGSDVFATFCRSCHGDAGLGDGPVTRRGVPPPPSLLAERARGLKDGQIFHIVTYGQANMAPLAAHLTREDRWKVVLHVRALQQRSAPEAPKESGP
jgi:mono/diheme cytochrome c family protein